MSIVNTIFNRDSLSDNANVRKIRYNRDHLLNAKDKDDFNTYLNFGFFPVAYDTVAAAYVPKKSTGTKDGKPIEIISEDEFVRDPVTDKAGTPGARSLFNPSGAVLIGSGDGEFTNIDIVNDAHEWRISNNMPLIDSPTNRNRIKKYSGCTIKELVNQSQAGLLGNARYSYADFMYCKHVGRVSNNYLITLRRFPLPVDDFIGTQGTYIKSKKAHKAQNAMQIGCMVTWLGVSGNDMANILKYNYKMPFKEQNSQWEDAAGSADSQPSVLGGMFAAFDPSYRKSYQQGYGGESANTFFKAIGAGDKLQSGPYNNLASFQDRNKVYGPVDAIKSTYIRSDQGLEFTQSFTLNFEYEIKSYNGVNGKQAMLDLISNILNVTYSTGSFWGGGYKGFAAHQSNIFANLNIFKTTGGFTNFIDAFAKDVSNVGHKVASNWNLIDADGNFSLKNLVKGLLGTLNDVGGMLLSGRLNELGRPVKAATNSLLSPAPVGLWHVTIGNPKAPIMSIGNMVITDCAIEHYGPLGIDDFPTGLKVSVTLSRGKPRDLRDIEKLYVHGNDRIYVSMGEKVFDMYKNAEKYKMHKENYTMELYKKEITSENNSINVPDLPQSDKAEQSYEKIWSTKMDLSSLRDLKTTLRKYFGGTDTYSVFVSAAEQEFGSTKAVKAATEQKPEDANKKPAS